MIDDLLVLRTYLLTDTPLTTLTGQRIYAGRNSPVEGWQPGDGACVVFKRRGGSQDESGAMVTTSFQFKCYGGGANVGQQIISANGVYRAVRDALNYGHSLAILGAQEEGRGSTFGTPLESEGDFPYVLCFFRVQMRETTIGV